MYEIIFYENSRGENNLLTYLRILEQKKELKKALKNYNTFIEDKKKENEKLESSKK